MSINHRYFLQKWMPLSILVINFHVVTDLLGILGVKFVRDSNSSIFFAIAQFLMELRMSLRTNRESEGFSCASRNLMILQKLAAASLNSVTYLL